MKNNSSNTEKPKDIYRVPNLEKGLSVMEYLSLYPKGKALQEIKDVLDISQTTTYRILNTLVRLDYLLYNEETKRYNLSMKVLNIGYRSLNEHDLLETVLPHLRDLRDQVKETVCFGVLGEEKGVFIEQAQGVHAFHFVLSPGKTFELHCSAPGKAIMAYLPDSIRERYLSYMQFEKYNERTITTRKEYLKELDEVRIQGYAIDNEEELSGVICIGSPVLNYTGYPVGAIWISGPKDRFTESISEHSVYCLKDIVAKISHELGFMKAYKK